MNKQRPLFLLTGDDSVRAEGLILVKRMVEGFADIAMVATNEQQSAVGEKVTIAKSMKWGKEIVDGHEAIWVDGTPSDAMFFANHYLQRKPDLVISGVNMGENPSVTVFNSGTVACAYVAAARLGIPAIAFSIQKSVSHWFRVHNGDFNEELLRYPGEALEKIIQMALRNGIPKYSFWNVNFPETPTEKIEFSKIAKKSYFVNEMSWDESELKYETGGIAIDPDPRTDSNLMQKGTISITPCQIDFTNHGEYERLKDLKIFG